MFSMKWLRHAFAVESAEPFAPTDEQRVLVERVCREVVARGLGTPAILFLEMSRPLGYVGAQAMHFFTPLVAAIADPHHVQQFAELVEQRCGVDYVLQALERELGATEALRHGDGEK